MIQRFFAMTLSIREEPRVFTAIWPVLPHWGNFRDHRYPFEPGSERLYAGRGAPPRQARLCQSRC